MEEFGSALAYTIMTYEMESGIAIDRHTNGVWLIQRLRMLPRYLEQKYGKKDDGLGNKTPTPKKGKQLLR